MRCLLISCLLTLFRQKYYNMQHAIYYSPKWIFLSPPESENTIWRKMEHTTCYWGKSYKHVRTECPKATRSQYFNYTGLYSMVLLALSIPFAIGTINFKHVRTECPKLTRSQYFNYKELYSMVLLALCNNKFYYTIMTMQ